MLLRIKYGTSNIYNILHVMLFLEREQDSSRIGCKRKCSTTEWSLEKRTKESLSPVVPMLSYQGRAAEALTVHTFCMVEYV